MFLYKFYRKYRLYLSFLLPWWYVHLRIPGKFWSFVWGGSGILWFYFSFHMVIDHLNILFCEMPVQVFCLFSLEVSAFSYWLAGVFYILGWVLCQICSTNICSYSMACSLSLMVTFHGIEVFSFNVVWLINIFFLLLVLSVSCLKNLGLLQDHEDILLCFSLKVIYFTSHI